GSSPCRPVSPWRRRAGRRRSQPPKPDRTLIHRSGPVQTPFTPTAPTGYVLTWLTIMESCVGHVVDVQARRARSAICTLSRVCRAVGRSCVSVRADGEDRTGHNGGTDRVLRGVGAAGLPDTDHRQRAHAARLPSPSCSTYGASSGSDSTVSIRKSCG